VISVVMPTRDRARVLERSLAALQREHPGEVVVVDDGSLDDTPDVVARNAWVRSVRLAGEGRSAAKNAGVAAASGDIVLFMDDDVIATEGLVARHERHHAEHPEEQEALLGHVTWAPELEITRHMRWLERGGPLFAYDEIDDPQNVPFRMLYTANVSLKRSFLERFDTDLPIYEDTELAYRLSKRGLRLRYDPHALGHHLREETPERTEARMEEVGRAAALLHAKWPELREPPPRLRTVGRMKAAAAATVSRAGFHGLDDRLDDWRAARAYARGYTSGADSLAAGGRRSGQLARRSSRR
jgi:glycosyltransferase involved in cell wall biosynthesis